MSKYKETLALILNMLNISLKQRNNYGVTPLNSEKLSKFNVS